MHWINILLICDFLKNRGYPAPFPTIHHDKSASVSEATSSYEAGIIKIITRNGAGSSIFQPKFKKLWEKLGQKKKCSILTGFTLLFGRPISELGDPRSFRSWCFQFSTFFQTPTPIASTREAQLKIGAIGVGVNKPATAFSFIELALSSPKGNRGFTF